MVDLDYGGSIGLEGLFLRENWLSGVVFDGHLEAQMVANNRRPTS